MAIGTTALLTCMLALSPPPADADERWAAAARARHWQRLDEVAIERLGLGVTGEDATADGGACWPFVGLAPHPTRFPALGRGDTRPVATVEWRRIASGQYLESFVEGDARNVDLAREARRDAASRHASDATRPATAWARDPAVPGAFDPEAAGSGTWSTAMNRATWASSWTDCYEFGSDGMRLLVTADLAAGFAELRVVRADGLGKPEIHRFADPGAFGWQGPTYGLLLLATDLDADGTRDFLLASYGCGNWACELEGVVVTSSPDGARVRFNELTSLGMALIDLDGNRRAEILSRSYASVERCTDGRRHNFWVTQLLGFQDLSIVDLRGIHAIRHEGFTGRFPAFEWLSFDPKERFRPLLTEEQRRELGETPFPPYRRRTSSIR